MAPSRRVLSACSSGIAVFCVIGNDGRTGRTVQMKLTKIGLDASESSGSLCSGMDGTAALDAVIYHVEVTVRVDASTANTVEHVMMVQRLLCADVKLTDDGNCLKYRKGN